MPVETLQAHLKLNMPPALMGTRGVWLEASPTHLDANGEPKYPGVSNEVAVAKLACGTCKNCLNEANKQACHMRGLLHGFGIHQVHLRRCSRVLVNPRECLIAYEVYESRDDDERDEWEKATKERGDTGVSGSKVHKPYW